MVHLNLSINARQLNFAKLNLLNIDTNLLMIILISIHEKLFNKWRVSVKIKNKITSKHDQKVINRFYRLSHGWQ